jgi:hypothetical protein
LSAIQQTALFTILFQNPEMIGKMSHVPLDKHKSIVPRELSVPGAAESITLRDSLRGNRIRQRLRWTLAWNERITHAQAARHRHKATGAAPGYAQ